MQPDKGRLAAKRADHQRDMLLAASRSRERRPSGWAANRRAAVWPGRRSLPTGVAVAPRCPPGRLRLRLGPDQPQRGQQAGRAAPASAPRWRIRMSTGIACAARSGRDRNRARVGQRPRRFAVQPFAMPHLDRVIRAGGLPLIGESKRRRARTAEQHWRAAVRIEQLEHRPAGGFDRQDGGLAPIRTGRPACSAAIARSIGDASSHRQLDDQRDMVRRPLPAAARLQHAVRGDLRGKRRASTTYGRAGGRDRSPPSPGRGSSTR